MEEPQESLRNSLPLPSLGSADVSGHVTRMKILNGGQEVENGYDRSRNCASLAAV